MSSSWCATIAPPTSSSRSATTPGQPGADNILFADGLQGKIALTSGQLSITDDLTIDGPGADLLAVNGNHQSRIVSISGGATVAIAGLTITDGRAVGDGGGILNTGSTLSLAGVILSNNQAVGVPGGNGRGGAIANVSGGTLTVTDSLFTQNQARGGGQGFGGGIFNLASRLTVRHSTFSGNQAIGGAGGGAARGGGIDTTNGSTASITDSTLIGNQAIAGDGTGGNGFGRGGGIYNFQATLTVENCIIQGNLARGGSNNTFRGPLVAPAAGAGIFNADGATLFLTGSTITGNRALGGSKNTSTGGSGDIGIAFKEFTQSPRQVVQQRIVRFRHCSPSFIHQGVERSGTASCIPSSCRYFHHVPSAVGHGDVLVGT